MRLAEVLWLDPDKMPVATDQALARNKKRINDLLKPYLQGQEAIVAAPFRGYCTRVRLNSVEHKSG
jgi:hypothetical protein